MMRIKRILLGKMRVKLSNKFYKKEALNEAIESFKDVCECQILNDAFEIELTPKADFSHPDLGMEFCNFVLGITKDKMLF